MMKIYPIQEEIKERKLIFEFLSPVQFSINAPGLILQYIMV